MLSKTAEVSRSCQGVNIPRSPILHLTLYCVQLCMKRELLSSQGAWNVTRRQCLANRVTLANTWWTRLRGLIGHKSLASGMGLWIVPCRGVHTLGMSFAIDAVYLNRDGVVVHVETNLRPWRLGAVRLITASVLELAAGTVSRTRTQVSDQIEFRVASELGAQGRRE